MQPEKSPPGTAAAALKVARRLLAALVILAVGLAAYGYAEATRTPRVVAYRVASAAWTAPPVRIALISDTHVNGPDMPPERLARVVTQVNALRPDLVLLAGDYLGGRILPGRSYSPAQGLAPFAALRAPLGVYAVLGNHDMLDPGPPEAIAAALRSAGAVVLRNTAARTRAGFWIAGADDPALHADLPAALARVPRGAPVLALVHNPDLFVEVPPRVALTLAGHTHGGQIAPQFIGPIVLPVNDRRLARGLITIDGRRIVVTSGIGASALPIRIGVPPEIALITLSGGAHARDAASSR